MTPDGPGTTGDGLPSSPPAHPIALVGMMGTGKSSVGGRVASRLGMPFVDSDAEIEARTGSTIAELFATRGEAAFRQLEAEVIAELLVRDPAPVIATGGGAVLDAATRVLLRAHACVVWLRARPSTLVHRIRADGTRPLLGDDPRAALERIDAERAPLYGEVSARVVDVDHRDRRAVVDEVLEAVAWETAG